MEQIIEKALDIIFPRKSNEVITNIIPKWQRILFTIVTTILTILIILVVGVFAVFMFKEGLMLSSILFFLMIFLFIFAIFKKIKRRLKK